MVQPENAIFSSDEWAELADDMGLPPRQRQIVHHLLAGMSDKQIAVELEISVPTVRTHLARLFERFGVQDRTELILYVFRRFRHACRSQECHR